MRMLTLISILLFAAGSSALSLNQGELFELVQVNSAKKVVSVTSDGQGTVLVIDAEMHWGQAPVVTFEQNVSECLLESIELKSVNGKKMNYWLKVRATKNTDFDGCVIKIKTYEEEFQVNYSFWTS